MSKELYVDFVNELPSMLKRVSEFPDHLQETAFEGMWRAFVAPPCGVVHSEGTGISAVQSADDTIITSNGSSGDWDYRRELIDFISRDGIDMENINGYERAAVVAYVFRILAPEVHRNTAITAEILVEACRQARVRLPANPSATLSGSKKVGLLDSAKGSSGYVLSPKGENFVNKLVTGTTEKS